MKRFRLDLALLLALTSACRAPAGVKTQAGHLEASWTGADTGKISGPATAEWCEPLRLLEIRAIRGDTGIALAIYPGVVLSPDTYRVVAPKGADSVVPSARVALRWFGATAINGFQGDSGTVVVERTDSGELSGNVAARASSVSNSQRVTVTGKFRDLNVVDQLRGCVPDSSSETPDSQSADPDGVD